jgi:hypothetical protein
MSGHIISYRPTDHVVGNASSISTTEDIEDYEERQRKKIQADLAKQKTIQVTLGLNNDDINPDPRQAFLEEHKIQYTEPKPCEFCGFENIVYRQSDFIYSRKLGRDRNITTRNSYGIETGIEIDNTKRDRFKNYQDDLGCYQAHFCNVEKMNEEQLRRYVKHTVRRQVEFEKKMLLDFSEFKKSAYMKPVYFDRD